MSLKTKLYSELSLSALPARVVQMADKGRIEPTLNEDEGEPDSPGQLVKRTRDGVVGAIPDGQRVYSDERFDQDEEAWHERQAAEHMNREIDAAVTNGDQTRLAEIFREYRNNLGREEQEQALLKILQAASQELAQEMSDAICNSSFFVQYDETAIAIHKKAGNKQALWDIYSNAPQNTYFGKFCEILSSLKNLNEDNTRIEVAVTEKLVEAQSNDTSVIDYLESAMELVSNPSNLTKILNESKFQEVRFCCAAKLGEDQVVNLLLEVDAAEGWHANYSQVRALIGEDFGLSSPTAFERIAREAQSEELVFSNGLYNLESQTAFAILMTKQFDDSGSALDYFKDGLANGSLVLSEEQIAELAQNAADRGFAELVDEWKNNADN